MNLFSMELFVNKIESGEPIMFHNIEMSKEETKRRFLNIFHKNGKSGYTKKEHFMSDILIQERPKLILEIDPEELKKENDFDDDDFAALQHPVNILKNKDNTKGVITRIIPDSKH